MSIPSKRLGSVLTLAATVGLALALAGCASAPGSVSPVASPPGTPSAEPVDAPEAAPVTDPTVEPAVDPTTCETILTPLALEDLASSNLVPREFSPNSWDYPLLATMHDDGLVCMWGNQGDVRQVMGELPMEQSIWESTRTQLLAEGFVEENDVVAGFLNGPDSADDSYPYRGFAYRDGTVYYTSYSKFFPTFASWESAQ